jgi:AcrR family transcriptional regulator
MARRGPSAANHGDATRDKLLLAAVDVFGRHSFDGTSTRLLAEAAGVNLQAITYYFGGKDGLYRAAAGHIAAAVSDLVTPAREPIRARLANAERAGGTIDTTEARRLLTGLLRTMAALFASPRSEPWARFILREQMDPTAAFQVLFDGMMKPLLAVSVPLVAILLKEEPSSRHVRLRTLSLVGSVMVFRVAHAAVLRILETPVLGPAEADAIANLADELIEAIEPRGEIP